MNTRYFLTVIAGAFSAVALAVIFPSLVPAPVTEVLGAPETQATFQKNLIPMTDSTYTLGTTTKTWLNLYTDEICLAGDCQTAWPVGGAGSFASSSPWTNGYLAYVVDNNTFSSVATGTLTENLTGLEFDATRGLVGGSGVLTLTSGYEIPTTTRMITWDTAYSWGNHAVAGYDQVTTAGDGLTRTVNDFDCDTASGTVFGCLSSADWTTFNNKQDTITAGDALTLTGTDIDFDGGATPSGDLGGTWASPSVSDDSHAHTGTTISGLSLSGDTDIAVTHPILLSGSTLSLAFSTTTANSWSSLQTFTYASTTGISGTNLNFTNATSTTLFATDAYFTKLHGTTTKSFSIASTTSGTGGSFGSATTTFLLANDPEPVTLIGWYCMATTTGSVSVRFGDGTNWTESGNCSTGGTTYPSSNTTFTSFENFQVQIGSSASSPNRVTITTFIRK